MPGTFQEVLPFGQWFEYSVENVIVNDNNYFVTVIYSGRNTPADKYLHHWFGSHPALLQLREETNFREVDTSNPLYPSYLQKAIPNTPAVLITRPAENGPFGQTVFLAYGPHLSTDPNEMVAQIQKSVNSYEQQNYQPQTIEQLPPIVPKVEKDNTITVSSNWVLFLVAAAVAYLFLTKTNRRKRR